MKVYITKYALSAGILFRDGKLDGNMFGCKNDAGYQEYYHAGEFFKEFYSALADCQHRRNKKIESLKKQIAKLEQMKFSIPEVAGEVEEVKS